MVFRDEYATLTSGDIYYNLEITIQTALEFSEWKANESSVMDDFEGGGR